MGQKFSGTDLPDLESSKDTTAVRKAILDLLDKINQVSDSLPTGFVYTQYPGQPEPAAAFSGTWLNITSLYAGLFFRAEGGNALAFNAGTQLDSLQDHTHDNLGSAAAGGAGGYAQSASNVSQPTVSRGVLAPARFSTETRSINQSVRIWKKSS